MSTATPRLLEERKLDESRPELDKAGQRNWRKMQAASVAVAYSGHSFSLLLSPGATVLKAAGSVCKHTG